MFNNILHTSKYNCPVEEGQGYFWDCFFVPKSSLQDYKKEGQLESLGFKFVLDGQHFLESCGGFAPAPGPPAGLWHQQEGSWLCKQLHMVGTWQVQVWRESLGELYCKYLPGSPTSWVMISPSQKDQNGSIWVSSSGEGDCCFLYAPH